jgi:hypothetical protein
MKRRASSNARGVAAFLYTLGERHGKESIA